MYFKIIITSNLGKLIYFNFNSDPTLYDFKQFKNVLKILGNRCIYKEYKYIELNKNILIKL